MRRTVVRLPSAALILATARSSICHESTGTSLSSFPKTPYPVFLTVNFSPRFDTTPTQLPSCCGARFAAAVFGTFCLAGAGCARAAAAPPRSNSSVTTVRLMLIPPLAMDVRGNFIESLQAGRFYRPTVVRLPQCVANRHQRRGRSRITLRSIRATGSPRERRVGQEPHGRAGDNLRLFLAKFHQAVGLGQRRDH